MDALPKLEIIGCYGVGVDAIDLAHAAERKVIVTNTPDVLNDDVANMAIALLLATSREICNGDRYVREGKWLQRPMHLTRALRGRRLGRSEEHTSELQSLMRISYAVFCLKKKTHTQHH